MTKKHRLLALATSPLALLAIGLAVFGAGEANVPNQFLPNTIAQSAQVNANFSALATRITANVPVRTRIEYTTHGEVGPSGGFSQLHSLGTFVKQQADTDIILDWHSDVRANQSSSEAFAQFQIRIDGVADSAGTTGPYWHCGQSSSGQVHGFVSQRAIFRGLAVGTHTISVYVRGSAVTGVRDNAYDQAVTVLVEESPSR